MEMAVQAKSEITGETVSVGDTVTSFRGETATLIKLTRPQVSGKSGKVFVKWDELDYTGEYYDSVFNLIVFDPELNVWGTKKSEINADEFCVECEREVPRTTTIARSTRSE